MGTLRLKLLGVNAYVPHTNGKALLAVLPNASRLGASPAGSLDGTPLSCHLPFIWEYTIASGNFSVGRPEVFPGARLSFDLTYDPDPDLLDLSAISPLATKGWLDVAPSLLKAKADDRLAGQVLIQAGTVSVIEKDCDKAWSRTFGGSLDTVVIGLEVLIKNVKSIRAIATKWVGTGDPEKEVFRRVNIGEREIELRIGNFCAEDALDWPQNSDASGRVRDADFKWIYNLSKSSKLHAWINGSLPVPVVKGSQIRDNFTPSFAFEKFWDGGGGAGCQCNGCIDKSADFS
jgi:hypothetical protein